MRDRRGRLPPRAARSGVGDGLCAALGLENVSRAVESLDDDEKMQVSPNLTSSEVARGGRDPWVVNEAGLYRLSQRELTPREGLLLLRLGRDGGLGLGLHLAPASRREAWVSSHSRARLRW